jgi:hypothetical protein
VNGGDTVAAEMPRGHMNGDANAEPPDTHNAMGGTTAGGAGMGATGMGVTGGEMPAGPMNGGAENAMGTMPMGTMPMGGMGAGMGTGAGMGATGGSPGPDGMPVGVTNDRQAGAKPGETTPNRAALDGAAGGLTIRGEWRLTLSSISVGSGG